MVNGFDEVYIERRGRLDKTPTGFPARTALLSAVHNVAQYVGREIDEDRPVLDARLPDGSRVHAVHAAQRPARHRTSRSANSPATSSAWTT